MNAVIINVKGTLNQQKIIGAFATDLIKYPNYLTCPCLPITEHNLLKIIMRLEGKSDE